ncbi:hypothetical protein INS49_007909 [Diaporthe citri]|uniref:uncharacterized protein n=1 Tax=Diaporthe citri TaxID=83186 RepID=UPI001C7EA4CF|nr:uncharacterized protein INS49_007909 [Diaporthe citri]KAG6362815.1 hypothetical protein INS49_007909 [Diaporthe citri]
MLLSETKTLSGVWMRDLDVDSRDEDLGPTIIVTSLVVYSCCTIFVLARILLRLRLLTKPTSDDYLTGLALMFGWAGAAFAVAAVQCGLGKHIATLDFEEAQYAVLWSMIGFCLTLLSISLPKVAVVALLVRLMSPSNALPYLLWSLAGLCFLVLLGHIPTVWTLYDTKFGCQNAKAFLNYSTFAGSYSAFVDMCLSVYPAFMLYNLRMKRRKRVGLGITLGIGSLDSIFAVLRTLSMPVDSSMLTIWGSIEGSMIIIAACIPLLLHLLDMLTRIIGWKELPPVRPYRPSRHITRRWITSGKTEVRASIPAQYRVICSCHASRPGPRDLLATANAHSNATQQDGPDFDWRRLDDADVGSGAGPDFKECLGLTDTEEEELMVWHFGRINGIVRHDEVTVAYEDAPLNLPEILVEAHTTRTFPATYP